MNRRTFIRTVTVAAVPLAMSRKSVAARSLQSESSPLRVYCSEAWERVFTATNETTGTSDLSSSVFVTRENQDIGALFDYIYGFHKDALPIPSSVLTEESFTQVGDSGLIYSIKAGDEAPDESYPYWTVLVARKEQTVFAFVVRGADDQGNAASSFARTLLSDINDGREPLSIYEVPPHLRTVVVDVHWTPEVGWSQVPTPTPKSESDPVALYCSDAWLATFESPTLTEDTDWTLRIENWTYKVREYQHVEEVLNAQINRCTGIRELDNLYFAKQFVTSGAQTADDSKGADYTRAGDSGRIYFANWNVGEYGYHAASIAVSKDTLVYYIVAEGRAEQESLVDNLITVLLDKHRGAESHTLGKGDVPNNLVPIENVHYS